MPICVLVAYATRYGSTREVAEKIAASLGVCGLAADVQPAAAVASLEGYQAVVLGTPLWMFHFLPDAVRFLARHRHSLQSLPVALFVLGPTHVPHDEPEWQSSRSQADQEMAAFDWLVPVKHTVFGGKYDPDKLGLPWKLLAGKAPASDLRDWAVIQAWAGELAAKLARLGPETIESPENR